VYQHRGFLTFATLMIPAGVIATLAGWYVTEVGRQPWVVQGLVRTVDAASPIAAEKVLFSLTLFALIYGVLLVVYGFFMRKLILQGPDDTVLVAPQPQREL
jgi:cytochrome d ubiquinol oxidase subunit I